MAIIRRISDGAREILNECNRDAYEWERGFRDSWDDDTVECSEEEIRAAYEAAMREMPANPLPTPEEVAAMARELGLDEPPF